MTVDKFAPKLFVVMNARATFFHVFADVNEFPHRVTVKGLSNKEEDAPRQSCD